MHNKRKKKHDKMLPVCLIMALLALVLSFFLLLDRPGPAGNTEAPTTVPTEASTAAPTEAPTEEPTEPPTEPPTWMRFEEGRQLTASQYFVYDVENSRFLKISGSQDDRVYQASITKLFTAYTAMQCLDLDTVITVGDALELVPPDSSFAGLNAGDQITVKHLIAGMMMNSGNDAAQTLAVACGRTLAGDSSLSPQEAVDRFVAEMNTQAQSVGLTDSHFVTPDGRHADGHYTTIRDLVRLAKLSLKDSTIMTYVHSANETFTLASGNQLTLKNTNALIQPESEYYCPYAIGMKTGYTDAAGNCLLSVFWYEGNPLIIGVFGAPTRNDRCADTLQLFNEAVGIPYAEPTEPASEE